MQTSRFKGVFSKRRRHSTIGESERLDQNTTPGIHELVVEVVNLEEPSTSLLRVAPQHVSEPRKDSVDECPEASWIPSTRAHSKPHKSFSGLSDAIEEFRSRPTRVLSRRKRGFFANKHTHSESCPADAVASASLFQRNGIATMTKISRPFLSFLALKLHPLDLLLPPKLLSLLRSSLVVRRHEQLRLRKTRSSTL